MCEFLSAIKVTNGETKWYYLTHDLIHNTPRGEMLQKRYCGDDLIGHSAIREYFNLESNQGENWECTDFSTPKNFPDVLVKAIKQGEFRGLSTPEGLLSANAWKLYNETTASARKLYEETIANAWKLYEETRASAWKLYEETRAPAGKLYNETTAPAWKLYNETRASAFWDLFANPDNRAEEWK